MATFAAVNPVKTYERISAEYAVKIAELRKRIALFSWGRLVLFLLAVAGVWYFNDQTNIAVGMGVACFAVFLFIVRKHADLRAEKDKAVAVKSYADFEMDFLNRKVKGYDKGAEFIDSAHSFSSDLDIFGDSSLFEYLNRTKSAEAKNILAGELKKNQTAPREILSQRERISEFGDKPEFIFRYLAGVEKAEEDKSSRSKSFAIALVKPYPKWAQLLLCYILPTIMLGLTAAMLIGSLPWSLYFQLILLSAIPVMLFLKKNMSDFRIYDERLKMAAAFDESLALLRSHEPKSDSLRAWFEEANLSLSGEAIASLKKINGAIDSRNNIFVGIILNLLLLWDFQCHRRLAKWDEEWSERFEDWVKLAHRMEVLFSFSIYRHNHPEFAYPELSEKNEFVLKKANHVFLHQSGVPNDFFIEGDRRFIIVTGANMAGKSTFLRTVGTNLILAMNGLPVPVEEMRFKPTRIFTSMVTADNLGEGESYFFSELKRLKQLTSILEKGESLFVILDEILKGTNSVDKAEGSRLFMEKLLDLPARGLIATHDLSLCEMQADYPNKIFNHSFEVEFRKNELHFDYTLREGVCQNMNARFLLQKMGLTKSTAPREE
jgi:hypothetical protein